MEIFDYNNCNEESLWKQVASHLKKHNIDTVLVGGAVVAIYSKGVYRSGDIDMIITSYFKEKLNEIMNLIGFEREGKYFIHPECQHLFIEFPPGPLGIGEDYNITPTEIKYNGVMIKILSPTDCVKDRLAIYIYDNDHEGYDQAILVAKNNKINLVEIKRWCIQENSELIFKEFMYKLKNRNNNNF